LQYAVTQSSLIIQAVPEPSSFALLAAGLLSGAAISRHSRIRTLL